MGKITIQVYECVSCGVVFQVHSTGVFFPPCPFCGKSNTLHRATQEMETSQISVLSRILDIRQGGSLLLCPPEYGLGKNDRSKLLFPPEL